VLPPPANIPNYALFLFCGLLPWTWFSASLIESANVLIAGGNLIKKVMFPAEILPIVTVLANLVHFLFGLPILVLFLIYFKAPLQLPELLWFPVVVFVQLLMTVGFALILSALTVHFRDIKDILVNVVTLWFFATPIIYRWDNPPKQIQRYLNLNPFTHIAISYQEILYFEGPFGNARWLLALLVASTGLFLFGYFLFDRLRDSFAEEV
jgi:ABC-type polysaccharide/polyol phosphate export permease